MMASAFTKSPDVNSERSGVMRRSFGQMLSIDACTFCSVRIFTICPMTPTTLSNFSRPKSGVPTLIAMTRVAPNSRASATGRLSVRPPSTRSASPKGTGANAPGIDIDARIACANVTFLESTTLAPVIRSVAIAA